MKNLPIEISSVFSNKRLLVVTILLLQSCVSYKSNDEYSKNIQSNFPGSTIDCKYTKGTNNSLIITSNLLTPTKIMKNSKVKIKNGVIAEIGKEVKVQKGDSQLNCKDTVLSPGFINAHEHLKYSYAGASKFLTPEYIHRDEWRRGLNGKQKLLQPYGSKDLFKNELENEQALLAWIELRHLLSGTTTIASSGGAEGLARSVDSSKNSNRYKFEHNVELKTFPFGFDAMADLPNNPTLEPNVNLSYDVAYVPHVGEGLESVAKLEVRNYLKCIEKRGKVCNSKRRYSLVHGIALEKEDFDTLVKNDVTLVWSPRSNISLYGETIDLASAKSSNVRLALATDWSPSGSFNLKQEAVCAIEESKRQGVNLSSKTLWEMMTVNASYALGLEEVIGTLKLGTEADLSLYSMDEKDNYFDAVIKDSTPLAVFVRGELVFSSLKELQSDNCISVNISGRKIHVCDQYTKYKDDKKDNWELISRINYNNLPLIGGYQKQAKCQK